MKSLQVIFGQYNAEGKQSGRKHRFTITPTDKRKSVKPADIAPTVGGEIWKRFNLQNKLQDIGIAGQPLGLTKSGFLHFTFIYDGKVYATIDATGQGELPLKVKLSHLESQDMVVNFVALTLNAIIS